ncbi:Aspartic proteinase nepenthesin-1 [Hibiscus syriacus]|uniref:Aspartic proteinase nepenthesin-1 n=1 Tax=Hibiscus syriacus TaxID=106335 RepID=A0A6A3A7A0_HIBSY|nr:Aspartic proteinase nepenthesin-1 [Hibiscus syriacus]
MASLYPTCCVLFLALTIVALHISPTVSTSRRVFVGWHEPELGFRVTLKHIDSGKNLTKWERILRGIIRGQHRLQKLNDMVLAAAGGSVGVKAPIAAGNGEYLMYLSIGTPPKSYYAIMDTGSDLIWIQCKPCSQCYQQSAPIFDPKKSSTYAKLPCKSHLCKALAQATCGNGCQYTYSYGDYSSSQGVMSTETLTFGKVLVPKIGFGCGEDNEGEGFLQGAGLVGLGRGALSLVSQLKEPKFSYCLVPFDDTKKTIILLPSTHGISVGKTRLPIDKSSFALRADGTGGLIIDSGTTITYLEENAFHEVKKEFIKKMKLPIDGSGVTGLDLCFTLPSGVTEVKVPKLVFHFEGADLDLPAENYMISTRSRDWFAWRWEARTTYRSLATSNSRIRWSFMISSRRLYRSSKHNATSALVLLEEESFVHLQNLAYMSQHDRKSHKLLTSPVRSSIKKPANIGTKSEHSSHAGISNDGASISLLNSKDTDRYRV